VVEAIRLHERVTRAEARGRAVALFDRVRIPDPEQRFGAFPHQLSGGLKQRVMIAMALAMRPRLLIADEPTTALDVTIQGQILELLKSLTESAGVGLVLITHNLGIVARYAHRVNVMYGGRIVEQGEAGELYRAPRHPYTVALLNSVPRMDREKGDLLSPIPGSPPDPGERVEGCRFRPRCGFAVAACERSAPELEFDGHGHGAACFNTEAVIASAPAA